MIVQCFGNKPYASTTNGVPTREHLRPNNQCIWPDSLEPKTGVSICVSEAIGSGFGIIRGRDGTLRTFKLPLVVKAFWHTVQRNGLSPVWVRMCICSAELDEKFLLHTWHKCLLACKPGKHTHDHTSAHNPAIGFS